MKRFRTTGMLLLVLLNIACDQVTKYYARQELSYYKQMPIWEPYFVLTKVENSGAFLSLGHQTSGPLRFIFLSLLPSFILAFGLYILIKQKNVPLLFSTGIAFALGGGIGNLYDRIAHGSVTDFLYFQYHFFKTGIFNLADMSITLGMILILISAALSRKSGLNSQIPIEQENHL